MLKTDVLVSIFSVLLSNENVDNTIVQTAACRTVSKIWREVVDDRVISRGLPPISAQSLAELAAPGRLRSILLLCRSHTNQFEDAYYCGKHDAQVASYNALVARAEACVLALRLGISSEERQTMKMTTTIRTPTPTPIVATVTKELFDLSISNGSDGPPKTAPFCVVGGSSWRQPEIGNAKNGRGDDDAYVVLLPVYLSRVTLAGVVRQTLRSPIFSWCTTLEADDVRLLEGCVGSVDLLNARWFGG